MLARLPEGKTPFSYGFPMKNGGSFHHFFHVYLHFPMKNGDFPM